MLRRLEWREVYTPSPPAPLRPLLLHGIPTSVGLHRSRTFLDTHPRTPTRPPPQPRCHLVSSPDPTVDSREALLPRVTLSPPPHPLQGRLWWRLWWGVSVTERGGRGALPVEPSVSSFSFGCCCCLGLFFLVEGFFWALVKTALGFSFSYFRLAAAPVASACKLSIYIPVYTIYTMYAPVASACELSIYIRIYTTYTYILYIQACELSIYIRVYTMCISCIYTYK